MSVNPKPEQILFFGRRPLSKVEIESLSHQRNGGRVRLKASLVFGGWRSFSVRLDAFLTTDGVSLNAAVWSGAAGSVVRVSCLYPASGG